MKRFLLLLLVAILAVGMPAPSYATTHHHHSATHKAKSHVKHRAKAGVDKAAAYSDIVIDAATGRVVHATNASSIRHPASLTKMMTLYITFQALEAGRLSLGQSLPVSENASIQSPSKLGLRAGQSIKVEDAILGLVTESANDAAVVIGEALGGSEDGFAQLMTRQARALGMTRTTFRNPSGLPDDEQVTTAHDMALLGSALINHYPQFYSYFDRDSFTYAGIYHHNHNHLKDRYDGMDGIKTGYIRASGFNLVASAKRGGVRLIGVVFGGHSAVARDNQMAQLLDDGFETAIADRRGGSAASTDGEGDGNETGGNDYVQLPAKVAAVFSARGAVAAPRPQRQPEPQKEMQVAQISAPTPPVPPTRPEVQEASVRIDQPRAPSAQAAPQTPARKPAGAWGIQIGAYSDAAIGRQALSDLGASVGGMLDGAEPQVQQIAAGGVTMYRARMMGLDKKGAQTICSYLIQRGKSCLTVAP